MRRLRVFTLTAAKPALDRVAHVACLTAAEVGWRQAEGLASDDEVAASVEALRAAWEEGIQTASHHYNAPDEVWALPRLVNVLVLVASQPDIAARQLIVPQPMTYPGQPVPLLTPEETRDCCWLLREIFGAGGRLLTSPWWESAWRTGTAVTLAHRMYESLDFGAMPILADALQDAGCDNDDILNHCRGDGPHVRGCWVVDLVLGKA
jgi:hypothetical protein